MKQETRLRKRIKYEEIKKHIKKGRNAGRPSKLTTTRLNQICRYIRIGCSYAVSARAVDISEDTLKLWIKKGREEKKGEYRDFYRALQKAEAEGEVGHVNQVKREGPTGSKWILTRRHPERWGNPDVAQTGQIDVNEISQDIVDTVNEMFKTIPLCLPAKPVEETV